MKHTLEETISNSLETVTRSEYGELLWKEKHGTLVGPGDSAKEVIARVKARQSIIRTYVAAQIMEQSGKLFDFGL
jgi:hypothetical protein